MSLRAIKALLGIGLLAMAAGIALAPSADARALAAALPGAILGGGLCFQVWVCPELRAARMLVLVLGWLLALRYFEWRFSSSLASPGASLEFVLGVSVLLLELMTDTVQSYNYWFASARLSNRSPEADRREGWYGKRPPLVDVFIATYNESLEILEPTIVAAQGIEYPNYRIWILDDGRRGWLQQYAQANGLRYLSRATNSHFKAGNLNYALEHVSRLERPPEFVAVLDADFMTRPQFLRRTLALMQDPSVALVQTPQEFFNPDPFQRAFGLRDEIPDDTRVQYRMRMRGLDGSGGVNCCGTSFLARVAHLRQIGGIPVDSVTEDLLTSLALRTVGLRCVYLDEALSVGLAPEGLAEQGAQRARWAIGLIQAGRSALSPVRRLPVPLRWLGRLTFDFKWLLLSLNRHVWLWLPGFVLVTGVGLLQAPIWQGVSCVLPLAAYRAFVMWLERGATLPLINDAIYALEAWSVIPASLREMVRREPHHFAVTDKAVRRPGRIIHWRPLGYFGAAAALNVLGVALAFHAAGELSFLACWSVFSALVATLAALPAIERRQLRRAERFAATERVRVQASSGPRLARLLDLSAGGCAIDAAGLQPGQRVRLAFSDIGSIRARVVRRRDDGGAALHFELEPEHRRRLILEIYCSSRYIHQIREWSLVALTAACCRRAFGRKARATPATSSPSLMKSLA